VIKELKNKRRQIIVSIAMICFSMSLSNLSYASSIQDNVFFTGSMKMLEDAGKALAIISPILGGVMIGYFYLRRGAADEMDQKKWSNRIKMAIGGGIGGALGGVIMTVVGSYFGIK
jgi:hypothetical protein